MNTEEEELKMKSEEKKVELNTEEKKLKPKSEEKEVELNTEENDVKPQIENRSSMEILSELFSTFHAEPPLLIKQEKSGSKKHKKKKKHKNKDKKQKKKSKKRKHSSESESSSSSALDFDFANLLVKHELTDEKKIKIEGTDISLSIDDIKESLPEDIEKDEKPMIKKLKVESDNNKIEEEGEISNQEVGSKQKKHKCKHKLKRQKSKERSEKHKKTSSESKSKHDHTRSKSEEKHKSKNSFYDTTDKSEFRKSKSPCRYSDSKFKRKKDNDDERTSRYNSFYDNHRSRDRSNDRYNSTEDFYKFRDKTYEYSRDDQWRVSKRPRGYSRERNYRERYTSPGREGSSHIDKKKLLEIARKNAIQMMKSGQLPGALSLGTQAQEKVIAAIKSGGKTIEELTDFCKSLSRKEDLGELSDSDQKGSDSDTDKPFNHPFQMKDRPTSITMNIKNSVPLPIKSTQERTTELRMQFPVSSGQHHRKNESEWVPVEPKKDTPIVKPSIVLTKEVVPITPLVPPTESASYLSTIPMTSSVPTVQSHQLPVDIGAIVSQRLSAMRKLQENPNDVQALTQMYKSTKEVQSWAESKQEPGQFTGSIGGNFLSQAELSSGYQAWAKKGQLQTAAPVSGGMGMHLLQKMGWKPGEGLGKEKTGALEPLLLEVKLDKKGLVANEEMQKKRKMRDRNNVPKNVQDKHPVSLLGEYASKKKLGAPLYELCLESGPDHKKNFLFKVTLNGIEFKPNVASPNKKEAKAVAATLCLQKLGMMT